LGRAFARSRATKSNRAASGGARLGRRAATRVQGGERRRVSRAVSGSAHPGRRAAARGHRRLGCSVEGGGRQHRRPGAAAPVFPGTLPL